MLSNISWQGYWTTLAVTIVLYYTFVFFVCYRKPVLQWIHQRLAIPESNALWGHEPTQHPSLFENVPILTTPEEDGPEYIPAVRSLVDEVHAFFESINAVSHTKATLLANLKTIIRKYPDVKATPYQHSLNHLIVFLAEQNGALHLSAEEVGSVWL